MFRVDLAMQVGTGQRMTGQSAGLVVFVTTGHGVDVRTGGSVVTPMLILVWVLVLVLVGVVVVRVGGRRVREVDEVVGHARALVRNSMPQPL